MKFLAILLVCFTAVSTGSLFQAEWEAWKEKYGKTYKYGEEIKRRYIWGQNLKFVLRHNTEADNGVHTYRLGMNKFADLDTEEWEAIFMCRMAEPVGAKSYCQVSHDYGDSLNNDTVDWRKLGYVTPVKNQMSCGSCYAFSATGALEGQNYKKSGILVSLSEQNIIDCSKKQGNFGCRGGHVDMSFKYIKVNNGIDSEKSYPYKNGEGKCHYNKSAVGATLTDCVSIPSKNEESLQNAVSTIGPISVDIDASRQTFRFYKSGVYYERHCSSSIKSLTHSVLVVGYGTEGDKSYWIVKNSWGDTWGMEGYILMSRNRKNNCGIATRAKYPIV